MVVDNGKSDMNDSAVIEASVESEAKVQVVHEWRRRHADFPEPVATLKTALIWDWREVLRWAHSTSRIKQ